MLIYRREAARSCGFANPLTPSSVSIGPPTVVVRVLVVVVVVVRVRVRVRVRDLPDTLLRSVDARALATRAARAR